MHKLYTRAQLSNLQRQRNIVYSRLPCAMPEEDATVERDCTAQSAVKYVDRLIDRLGFAVGDRVLNDVAISTSWKRG